MNNYNEIIQIFKQNGNYSITPELERFILLSINQSNTKEKLSLIYSLYAYVHSEDDNSGIKKLLKKEFDILFKDNFHWSSFIKSELYLHDSNIDFSKINFNHTISLFYNSFKERFIEDYFSSSAEDKNDLLIFLSKIFLKNKVFTDSDSIHLWNNMGFNNKEKRDEFLFKINNLEQFQNIANVFNIKLDDIGVLNDKQIFIGSAIIKNLRLHVKQKEISKKSFLFIFDYLKKSLETITDKELKENLLNSLVLNSERFFSVNSDICFSSDFKKLNLSIKIHDSEEKEKELGILILKSRNLSKFHKYNKINKYNYKYEPYYLFNIIPKKYHLLTVGKSFALELFNFNNIDYNQVLEKYAESKNIDFYFPLRPKAYLSKSNSFDYFSFSTFYANENKENVSFRSFINFFELVNTSNFKFNNNSLFLFLNKIIFSNLSFFENLTNLKIETEFDKFSNEEKKEIMQKLLEYNNFIKNFDDNCLEYHNNAINVKTTGFKKHSYCFNILNLLLSNCLKNKIYFNIDDHVINKIQTFSSYFDATKILIKNLSFISLSNNVKVSTLIKTKPKI